MVGLVWRQHIISASKLLSSSYSLSFSLCFINFLCFSLLIDLQNHYIIDSNLFNTRVDLHTYDHPFIQRWVE